MTTSYSLAPVPKWYIADLVGKPLAGGYMATFSSLNHAQFKAVYEDPAGSFPWPYVTIPNVGSLGILFDENGSQGPFYFKFDSTTPADLYYIEIYDANGVLQWTIDDFTGTGSGGGGTITEALNLQNLIPNNVMYRNLGTSAVTPTTLTTIAPGANTGLVLTASLAGPDISFIKNNTTATDAISFPKFPLGSNALTGDVTPVDYLHFVCSGAGTGETSKYVQFPITQGAQNLTNQAVTVTIWARCTSGNTSLTLYFLQFYGDGPSASAATRFAIQTLTLTSSWQRFSVQTTVPDATGKTIGECGNDGLFFQVEYPLDATTTIDFTKPCVFLGTIAPDQQYDTYDAIDGVVDGFRTGDIKEIAYGSIPNGWIALNNGSIGSASSGATNRANVDTFPLFRVLWDYIPGDAPMYTSAGTYQARGASAVADFAANYQIQLLKSLGSVFAGSTPFVAPAQVYTADHTTGYLTFAGPPYASTYGTGSPVVLVNSGGAVPAGLALNVIYYSIYVNATTMQLALSPNLAKLGTAISFTDNGSGTNSITFRDDTVGEFEGERAHIQQPNEVALNQLFTQSKFAYSTPNGSDSVIQLNATSTSGAAGPNPWYVGNSSPVGMNVVQPTTYIGRIIKL